MGGGGKFLYAHRRRPLFIMAAGFPGNPSCPSGRPDHPPERLSREFAPLCCGCEAGTGEEDGEKDGHELRTLA
eukprot:1187153-Prorocentrum_minimum.AAC.1